ncbi:MAG TPA: hypothetical protein VH761_00445 [Ilumatobacteraceae bacterium]
MELVWGYRPSSLGRTVAEEWIAANDCSIVERIVIGEHSLSVTSHGATRRAVTIRIDRQWDLAADLSEALTVLRAELAPPRLRARRWVRSTRPWQASAK